LTQNLSAQWQYNGSDIYYNDGKVGIGTLNPSTTLHLYSPGLSRLTLENSGDVSGNQITFKDAGGTCNWNIYSGKNGYTDFNSILEILHSGKVGILTSNPQYTLDVNGTINATNILKNGQSIGQWNNGLNSSIYYNSGYIGLGTDQPAFPVDIQSTAPWPLRIQNTSTGTGIAFSDINGLGWINYLGGSYGYMDFFNKFRIMNNGNVGINNANPNYKLDVGGTINATEILKNGQALGQWSVNGTSMYYNDGNIGIGTNNPQQKLDVNGTINVSNGIINNSSDPSAFPLRFSAMGNNDWGIEITGYPDNNSSKLNTKKNNLTSNLKNEVNLFQIGMGLRIRDDGLNAFYIKDKISNQYRMVISHGNIGIGTTSPGYNLDVNGSINATNIYQNGQPIASSQWSSNGSNLYYNNGNIGLNTNNPTEQLQLGDRFVFHNGGQKIIGYNFHYDGQDKRILQAPVSNLCLRDDGGVLFRTAPSDIAGSIINWTNSLFISNAGNVCIGMTNPYIIYNQPATLSVNGSIVSKETHVRVNGWSDFVFKNGYKPKTIEEVANYIKDNGHLEGIPTEKDVEENGIEIGQTTVKLLQKIEELTLYIVDQNNKIKKLEEKLNK